MTDILTRKGSVYFNDFSLINFNASNKVNLSSNIVEMKIEEDLFSNCIRGSCQVREGTGIFSSFPVIGEETLMVDFTVSPTEPMPSFKKSFLVHSIKELESDPINSTQGYLYKLEFCSPEFVRNESIKLNLGYKDVPISDMVTDIFKKYLQVDNKSKFTVETTTSPQTFIIPALKPLQAINLLSSYADNGSTLGANYFLFFEDQNGFNFINLVSLYSQSPIFSFAFVPDIAYSPIEDAPSPLSIPLSYKLSSGQDKLSLIASGAFGSRVVAVDSIAKSFTFDRYDYNSEFKRKPQIGGSGYTLSSDNFPYVDSSMLKVVPTSHIRTDSNFYKRNNTDTTTSKGYETLLTRRMATLGQANSINLKLVVSGNTLLTVGRLVNVELPYLTADSNSDGKTNVPRYSGSYLISKIVHTFIGNRYYMELSLIRDSFTQSVLA